VVCWCGFAFASDAVLSWVWSEMKKWTLKSSFRWIVCFSARCTTRWTWSLVALTSSFQISQRSSTLQRSNRNRRCRLLRKNVVNALPFFSYYCYLHRTRMLCFVFCLFVCLFVFLFISFFSAGLFLKSSERISVEYYGKVAYCSKRNWILVAIQSLVDSGPQYWILCLWKIADKLRYFLANYQWYLTKYYGRVRGEWLKNLALGILTLSHFADVIQAVRFQYTT